MDKKTAHRDAKVKAVKLDCLANELIELAELLTTTEEDCPLRNLNYINHYHLSYFIADQGWKWTCPFCGEENQH